MLDFASIVVIHVTIWHSGQHSEHSTRQASLINTGALVPNRNEGVRSTLLDPVEMIIINFYGFQYVCFMCSSILNFSNVVQALVINIAFWNSLNTFIITLTHFCNLRNLNISQKKRPRVYHVCDRVELSSRQFHE